MSSIRKIEEVIDRLEAAETPLDTIAVLTELYHLVDLIRTHAIASAVQTHSYRAVGQAAGGMTGEAVRQRMVKKNTGLKYRPTAAMLQTAKTCSECKQVSGTKHLDGCGRCYREEYVGGDE